MKIFRILLLLVVVATSCTILKKSDPEQEVRAFINTFQSSLLTPDEQILKQFEGGQSSQVILAVTRILQNKDQFVTCQADFASAHITMSEKDISIDVPVTLNFKDDETDSDISSEATLTLWLVVKDKKYVISKLEGEKLYQAFTSLKNGNEWAIERRLALQERSWVYEKARALEQQFDTVIWYTTYNKVNYFYVVEGEWQNFFMSHRTRKQKNENAKMGLVNAQGEIIIPMEYDLIGTLSFDRESVVEVRKGGKSGYFDIEAKRLLVTPDYDMIIPYLTGETIVKQDTTYGWFDNNWQYHAGFPTDQAKEWVASFGYLKGTFSFDRNTHAYCEIPAEDRAGFGILIPPSYIVRSGLFSEIEGGLSTTKIPLNGWTEYVKTGKSLFEKVTDNVSALVTAITERYIEGREEFYEQNRIVFVNQKQDTVGVADLSGGGFRIRTIDSTLIEVVTSPAYDHYMGDFDVSELPIHTYFRLSDTQQVVRLMSSRLFPQTQYVRLDSTYLSEVYPNANPSETPDAVVTASLNTLIYMRNEILDEYGYRFKPSDDAASFEAESNYDPRFDTVEEFQDQLTEIDRYNLAFLEKVIGLMQQKSV